MFVHLAVEAQDLAFMTYEERFAEASARLGAQPQIRLTKVLVRLTDAVVLAGDLHRLYTDVARSALEDRMMRGVLGHLAELPLRDAMDEAAAEAVRQSLRNQIQEAAAQKQNMLGRRILNQGLVSVCTAFDILLDECIDLALRAKPEILYGEEASLRTISLKELVQAGSIEAVVGSARERVVRKLAYEGIRERLGWFQRRGLDVDALFRFEHVTDEVRRGLQRWDLGRLESLYNDRHGIVHGDALPIETLEFLSEISEVFTHLSFGLAAQLAAKFGILIDVSVPVLAQRIAESAGAGPVAT